MEEKEEKKRWECVKECWGKKSPGCKIVINVVSLVAIVIAGVLFFNFCPRGYDLLKDGSKWAPSSSVAEEDAWLYFITAVGTIALAIIAYTQIKQLITTSSGEFLLHIDERWSSKEILEARTIIHKMYVNTKPILRIYIKYKRSKRNNNDYYKNFIKLCNAIAKSPEEKPLPYDPLPYDPLPYLKSKGKED